MLIGFRKQRGQRALLTFSVKFLGAGGTCDGSIVGTNKFCQDELSFEGAADNSVPICGKAHKKLLCNNISFRKSSTQVGPNLYFGYLFWPVFFLHIKRLILRCVKVKPYYLVSFRRMIVKLEA